MKKYLAVAIALLMIFTLAACGGKGDDKAPASEAKTPSSSQQQEQPDKPVENEPEQKPEPAAEPEFEKEPAEEKTVPTTGTPLDWPENDYTKLVPTPNCGGQVTAANEIGTLFGIELKWEMEQGIAYARQLAEAGFGDDCAEKYEQYGYIDRTANGLNVQLLDLFGTCSISIMPVEEDDSTVGEQPADQDTSDSADSANKLFDIEQLAGIPEYPDFAKKAIGDLRWCDDLGSDSFGKYHYNAYMKVVTQEDFETYIANLAANAPNDPVEGDEFAYYWDWGQITGTYFPDTGTLDVILTAK